MLHTLKHSCEEVHVAGCVGPWLTQLQCGSGWPCTLVCGRVSHTQEWCAAQQQKAQQPGQVVCSVVLAAQDGATCVLHVLEEVSRKWVASASSKDTGNRPYMALCQ